MRLARAALSVLRLTVDIPGSVSSTGGGFSSSAVGDPLHSDASLFTLAGNARHKPDVQVLDQCRGSECSNNSSNTCNGAGSPTCPGGPLASTGFEQLIVVSGMLIRPRFSGAASFQSKNSVTVSFHGPLADTLKRNEPVSLNSWSCVNIPRRSTTTANDSAFRRSSVTLRFDSDWFSARTCQ